MKNTKRVFETYFEIFKAGNYNYALFDYINLEYDPPKSRAWFVTSYVSRYSKELGGRHCYFAVIEPNNMFQRIAASLIAISVQKIYSTLHVTFFTEVEKAQDWLLQTKVEEKTV